MPTPISAKSVTMRAVLSSKAPGAASATARKVSEVSHYFFTVAGKQYRATATRGGKQLKASEAEWKKLIEPFEPVVAKAFETSKERLNISLSKKGEVRLIQGKTVTTRSEPTLSTALRTFKATEDRGHGAVRAESHESSRREHVPARKKGKSAAEEREMKPTSVERELLNVNKAIDSPAFLASLQHIAKKHGNPIKILCPREAIGESEGELIPWELTVNPGHGIGSKQLLTNLQLPQDRTKIVYIPIRLAYHYVGLYITPEGTVFYYDSKGRPMDYYIRLGLPEAIAAIAGQIKGFTKVEESVEQYQKDDSIHCAAYQIHYFEHRCRNLPGPYTANTDLMIAYRKTLHDELRAARLKHKS